MSAQNIIALYERNAAEWDRQRGRELFEKSWLDRFMGQLPSAPTILDVGCGMGEPIASYLISRGARVTGIDASPSLIELCRTRFPEHEWLVGDMRSLHLGRKFDGILAWHSSFHLTPDDQEPLIPRFAAHVEPGGSLMFTSGWSRGEVIGEWQGEPLYHGSLDTEEYRSLLARSGFCVLDHVVGDPSCGYATIWLAQMSPANGLDGSA